MEPIRIGHAAAQFMSSYLATLPIHERVARDPGDRAARVPLGGVKRFHTPPPRRPDRKGIAADDLPTKDAEPEITQLEEEEPPSSPRHWPPSSPTHPAGVHWVDRLLAGKQLAEGVQPQPRPARPHGPRRQRMSEPQSRLGRSRSLPLETEQKEKGKERPMLYPAEHKAEHASEHGGHPLAAHPILTNRSRLAATALAPRQRQASMKSDVAAALAEKPAVAEEPSGEAGEKLTVAGKLSGEAEKMPAAGLKQRPHNQWLHKALSLGGEEGRDQAPEPTLDIEEPALETREPTVTGPQDEVLQQVQQVVVSGAEPPPADIMLLAENEAAAAAAAASTEPAVPLDSTLPPAMQVHAARSCEPPPGNVMGEAEQQASSDKQDKLGSPVVTSSSESSEQPPASVKVMHQMQAAAKELPGDVAAAAVSRQQPPPWAKVPAGSHVSHAAEELPGDVAAAAVSHEHLPPQLTAPAGSHVDAGGPAGKPTSHEPGAHQV